MAIAAWMLGGKEEIMTDTAWMNDNLEQAHDLIESIGPHFASLGLDQSFTRVLDAIERLDEDIREASADHEDPQADALFDSAKAIIAAERRRG